MQLAVFNRDVEAFADRIQRRRGPGPVRTRQRDGVDEAFLGECGTPKPFQFRVEESAVELSVVGDDRILAEEIHQRVDNVRIREPLLVAKKVVGEPGDPDGRFAERFFRIDVDLKFAAGLDVVDQLYTSDFDDAFSVAWLEPRCFGVECDFPHVSSVSVVAPSPRSALRISSTWTPA